LALLLGVVAETPDLTLGLVCCFLCNTTAGASSPAPSETVLVGAGGLFTSELEVPEEGVVEVLVDD
jgi:hypothetical protein